MSVKLGPGPVSVARQSQLPAVTITFNLGPGYTLGEAVIAMRDSSAGEDAGHHHRSVRRYGAGVRNSFRDQPILILAAILTIYIVLGISMRLHPPDHHPVRACPPASLGALLILLSLRRRGSPSSP
jgi:multidrug efflux pump subunit AcrB